MNPDYKPSDYRPDYKHWDVQDIYEDLARKAKPREPQKCTCVLMRGCTCGVMEAEMRAKGFKRGPEFGGEKWVRIS